MKQTDLNHNGQSPISFLKNTWKAFALLFIGLVLTFAATTYTAKRVERRETNEFSLVCNELKTKIEARLHAHAQLLRSGSSLFMACDTVSRNEWKSFIEKSKLERNLPGVQGVGFACIIPKAQLQNHIQSIRNQGFPNYSVKPVDERDIYTSIIYLEPFEGRNLRAFGYDMFTEPVRRKAMEMACDSDMVTLSGKVQLVQENYRDVQAGNLMYAPVYQNGKLTGTMAERRQAIMGWVYSPYRMNDLMLGILGSWASLDDKGINLKVYDTDSISENSLLFDSHKHGKVSIFDQPTESVSLKIDFNGTVWSLTFSQLKADLLFYESEVLLVSICGIIISLLLFGLALSLMLTKTKAEQMALQLTSELKLSKNKFKTVADYTYDWEYWESTDYQLIYMSPSCERVSGYKPEEFIADPLLLKKIIHHEDARIFDEHFQIAHSNGHQQELSEIKFRILKKDGTLVHIDHLCSPVYDDRGVYTGRRVSNRDITDAYHTEHLLAQTRRNYQAFFNTIDEFLFVLNQQGNIIYTNSTVIDRLGFSWDELKNQSVLMVHPPDRREEAGRIVALMLQGKAELCPVPLITKSGTLIPVETRVTAGIWDGKAAIFGVTKDVSQIRLSQEKYLKLFHLNPSAAGLSDLVTGEYIEVNEAFYALFGFDPGEVIGKTASSLGILTEETRKNIFRKADIFGNISNLEADLIAKNGDIKHVLLSAENIYIQDKKYRFTVVNDITERWESEIEKAELLGRLHKIASRLPGMVYQYKLHPDGSSCFPYTSDGINSIYRLSPEEVLYDASKVFERLHPDDFADVSSSIQASAKSLTAWRLEYRVKFDDGTIRWLSGNAIPQKETDGSILWHGFINDITDQKQVATDLAEERKRLELILDGTNAGTWQWDIVSGETILNERWANMIGYTLAEISPTNFETWIKFSHPDDLKTSNEMLAKHFNGEKDYYECESRMKHKDGSWVWILDRGKVNKWDTDGKPLLMAGTHQLITDRKQAELQLSVSENRYRRLFESSKDGILILNAETGMIIDVNPYLIDLLGYSKEQFIEKEIWEIGIFKDIVANKDKFAELQLSEFIRYEDLPLETSRGSQINVEFISNLYVEKNHRVMQCNIRDITNRKKNEAEIKLQNEELVKLNSEKDKFFSVIAHDMRSPFNGFLGLTQLLSEGINDFTNSEIQTVAVSMRKSALNLFSLLENLLEWSRMQRGLIPFNPTSIQLLQTTESCIALLQEAASAKRIDITCLISSDLTVFASSNMLQSVIRNLVSNAIKFTPLGGKVIVSAIPISNNKVEVAIKDSGIGMDEEIIGNLFKLGLSTGRRGTEGEASTGLGLYLCKDFIEKQGGKLWAVSTVGVGSTFRFTLPAKG